MEAPWKIAELDHIVLRCQDQARSLAFYTSLLGMREERRLESIGLIQLRAGQSMLDLIPAGEPRASAGNVEHFCFGIETTDINEVVRYLRERSVEIVDEPKMRYGARGMGLSIYIRDCDGNIVELKQMPAE